MTTIWMMSLRPIRVSNLGVLDVLYWGIEYTTCTLLGVFFARSKIYFAIQLHYGQESMIVKLLDIMYTFLCRHCLFPTYMSQTARINPWQYVSSCVWVHDGVYIRARVHALHVYFSTKWLPTSCVGAHLCFCVHRVAVVYHHESARTVYNAHDKMAATSKIRRLKTSQTRRQEDRWVSYRGTD